MSALLGTIAGEGADALFSAVLLASRDAAVLALAVGVILFAVGRRIPPAWRHGLWLLVVLRLLLPALPGGALSWQRLLPAPAPAVVAEPSVLPARPVDSPPSAPFAGPDEAAPVAPSEPTATVTPIPLPSDATLSAPSADPLAFDGRGALLLLWLAGAGGYLLLVAALVVRFRRRVWAMMADEVPGAAEAARLLEDLAREQGCRRVPALRITRAVPAPAVSGLLRTEILLPPSTLERLDETELRLVLLHELAHLRRRDLWIHWLLVLLQAVHWFNPVVWWAFHRLRVEAESAADAWALRRCGDETPLRYGETLLRLLEAENPPRRIGIPGVAGVVESPRDLRSRIRAIGRFSRRRNRLATIGAAALVAGLAAVGLTQAPKEGERTPPEATGELLLPEAIHSPTTRVSEVEITVVDEAGNPVEGAEVFVTAESDHLIQTLTPVLLRGRTDSRGRLSGRTAPVREDARFSHFDVIAFKEGFAAFAWLQPKPDPATGKVNFTASTLKGKIALSPAGTVRAKIVQPDGRPAAGLRVWVDAIGPSQTAGGFSPFGNPPRLPDGLWQAVSDENGIVELNGIPQEARIHLGHGRKEWAAFPGYYHYFMADGLAIADGIRTLTLAPAASVSGLVLSPSGKGVPNIVVDILERHPYGSVPSGYAISDADGFYQLHSLPEGHYELLANARSGHHRNFWILDGGRHFELGAGETLAKQDFVFKRGGRVEMRLIDEETGALIVEIGMGAGPEGIRKDLYHSGYTPEGYYENRQKYEAEIRAGEITYLDIPFKKRTPNDRISGAVVDAAGTPVPGAKVKCLTTNGEPFIERIMTETDDAGRFTLDLPLDTQEVRLIAWEGDRISDPFLHYPSGTEVEVVLKGNQFGTVVGRVTDGDGIPLPEAVVSSSAEELPGIIERFVETDAEGRFRIVALPSESVSFHFSKDGYGKASRHGKIEADTETDLGSIHLAAATASVAGRVVYADGRPASRAQLWIGGENQPDLENLATDTEGRFRIQGVAEGWFWMGAYDPLGENAYSERFRVRSGAEDVRIVLRPVPEPPLKEIKNLVGKPAPPLRVAHWYHVENPDPEYKGKIRLIHFIGKDRPLSSFSVSVKWMQEFQDEFAGKGVEFLLVHGAWPKEEVEEILAADHPGLTVPLAIESEEGAMSDAFGVPTTLTVVIDREGKVAYQDRSGRGSKAAVQKLLDAEKPATSPAAAPADPQTQPQEESGEAISFVCHVRDEAGNPVSGAEVFFQPNLRWMDSVGRFLEDVFVATSDAEGKATIVLDGIGPPPKEFVTGEWFARHATKGMAASGFRSIAIPPDPVEFVLREGAAMALKAVDDAGFPIAGLELRAVALNEVDIGFQSNPSARLPDFWTATTDTKGECVLLGLPEGKRVYVDHTDERYAQPEGRHHWKFQFVAHNTEPHILRLEPAATISGRVAFPDGRPVAGVRVRALEEFHYARGGGADEALTDADGRYVLKRLLASKYDIRVVLPGTLRGEWAEPIHAGIPLEKGQHFEASDIVLTRGALVTGRVTLPDTGEGVPHFRLGATSAAATSPLVQWWATTDSDGNYRFRLQPGERMVYPAGAPPKGYSRPKGGERPLTLHEGDQVVADFTLAGSSVEEKTTDAEAEAGGEEESTSAFDQGDASQVRLSVKVWREYGDRPDELIASPVAVTLLDEWTLFAERSEIRHPTAYGLPSLPEDLVAKASGGGVVGEAGKPEPKWETNTKGVVLPPHPSGFEGRSLGWTLKMRPERTRDGKVRVACVVEQEVLRGFVNHGVPITVMQPAGILRKEKPRVATENRQLLPVFLKGRRELLFEPEGKKLVAKVVSDTTGPAPGGETFVEGFADKLRSPDLPKLRIEVDATPVETVAEEGAKEKGEYQIYVTTRFVETDDVGERLWKNPILTDPQFQVLIGALNQRKGVDLLNAPSQMFRDGESKGVEIVREFIYPVSYDPPAFPPHEIKGDAKMISVSPAVPKDLEKANVGMTVQVKASLRPNRMIELELSPRRTEFHEFLDFGGAIHQAKNGRLTSVPISENRIEMPVFDVSSQRMKVRVPDGHTVCLVGFVLDRGIGVEDKLPVLGLVTDSKKEVERRYIHVFITAQLIYPKGVPVN